METVRGSKTKYKKTTFASKFEAEIAKKFDELGIHWEYEPIRIPWQPAVRYYKPDFRITLPSGETKLIECKGFFDPAARGKMAQIRAQYPDLDIDFMFMNEEKVISRKTANPTTYKAWAHKHGYSCFYPETLAVVEPKNVKRKTGRTGAH